jgi:hypothetical protein
MTDMLSLEDYKNAKKSKLLIANLRDLVALFDRFEKDLQPFRFYLPAKDLLNNLESNRMFASLSLKKLEETHNAEKEE